MSDDEVLAAVAGAGAVPEAARLLGVPTRAGAERVRRAVRRLVAEGRLRLAERHAPPAGWSAGVTPARYALPPHDERHR